VTFLIAKFINNLLRVLFQLLFIDSVTISIVLSAETSPSSNQFSFLLLSPHQNHNRYTKPNRTEHIDRQVTRECIKQSVPVVDGADGVDEGVVEGAGEDAFRGLVDGCHGK